MEPREIRPRPPAASSPKSLRVNVFDMNPFDAVVYAVAGVAIVMGFHAGLLRSLTTILGYLIATPIAIAIAPRVTALMPEQFTTSPERPWLALFVVFLALGVVISAMLRYAVSAFTGPDVNLLDRLAGALLGAVRIGLVAVLVVLVFDRIIPADRQPPFLADSRLRPYLSAAGQKGLKSLPPDVENYIDRLKREHGI
jgi:membrane protein required for colicin V production